MKENMHVGMRINILTIIACIWLIVSPQSLNFTATQTELTSNIVIGSTVLIIFALLSLIDPSLRLRLRENGIMLLCGVWLCIVAVIYSTGISAAFWSTLATGLGIVLLQSLYLTKLFLIVRKVLLRET